MCKLIMLSCFFIEGEFFNQLSNDLSVWETKDNVYDTTEIKINISVIFSNSKSRQIVKHDESAQWLKYKTY